MKVIDPWGMENASSASCAPPSTLRGRRWLCCGTGCSAVLGAGQQPAFLSSSASPTKSQVGRKQPMCRQMNCHLSSPTPGESPRREWVMLEGEGGCREPPPRMLWCLHGGRWHHLAPPNAFFTCLLGMARAWGMLPSSPLKPECATAFNTRSAMALGREAPALPLGKVSPAPCPPVPPSPGAVCL